MKIGFKEKSDEMGITAKKEQERLPMPTQGWTKTSKKGFPLWRW